MNTIFDAEIQKFISDHANESPVDIVLKFSGRINLPIKEIAEQIECRQKCINKLPELSKYDLLFKKVSLEQASSELTASYKASRVKGNKMLDLTGGLGIDSIYFSKNFDDVVYCEINEDLAGIAEYNFKKLGLRNIKTQAGDGIEFLKTQPADYFDWIYIDPSRREGNKRSVDIRFMKPDVISNMDLFFSKSKNILIKLAPAFDQTEAFRIFPDLHEFCVVSSDNECKEVLLFLIKETDMRKIISAVVIKSKELIEKFESALNDKSERIYSTGEGELYFYEPDTAIRKAGLSELISRKFQLNFLNPVSDYLVSSQLHNNFPGRVFKIINSFGYNINLIIEYLSMNNITKGNIARSYFAETVEQIRRRIKLKDGGEDYFFFTKSSASNFVCYHTRKI